MSRIVKEHLTHAEVITLFSSHLGVPEPLVRAFFHYQAKVMREELIRCGYVFIPGMGRFKSSVRANPIHLSTKTDSPISIYVTFKATTGIRKWIRDIARTDPKYVLESRNRTRVRQKKRKGKRKSVASLSYDMFIHSFPMIRDSLKTNKELEKYTDDFAVCFQEYLRKWLAKSDKDRQVLIR